MKYDDGYDDGDNDVHEGGNNDGNAAARSGSDGPIFDLIMTSWSGLSIVEKDWSSMVMELQPLRTMYLRVGL